MALPTDMARSELIAALCLLHEGDQAKEMFSLASQEDQPHLETSLQRLKELGDVSAEEVIEQVQRRHSVNTFSTLNDLHPGWILEPLEGETPRILGVLCRFLPGDKIRFLVDHLSRDKKKRLPSVQDSYKVSPQITEIVRHWMEEKFEHSMPERQGGSFSFAHTALMKAGDLEKLFRDLGLEEIRRSFFDVEPRILRAFLARFVPQLAREIRERIDRGERVLKEDRQEAQRHLVSLPLEEYVPEELFRQIGYSVFSRALSKDDLSWSPLIYQKFPPEIGYRLKRFFQENAGRYFGQKMERQKNEILGRIFELARRGVIRRYWKGET